MHLIWMLAFTVPFTFPFCTAKPSGTSWRLLGDRAQDLECQVRSRHQTWHAWRHRGAVVVTGGLGAAHMQRNVQVPQLNIPSSWPRASQSDEARHQERNQNQGLPPSSHFDSISASGSSTLVLQVTVLREGEEQVEGR